MSKVSSLASKKFPDLPKVSGVTLASGSGNIKTTNQSDVLLVELVPGSVAAGVFTKSRTAGAAVDWCRNILSENEVRGLVVNSGNANAFTGGAGIAAVKAISEKAANLIGCKTNQIYIAQTGVIGEPLPVERITKILPSLHGQMGSNWHEAAVTICTTDTYPKGATRTAEINGTSVTISGIAKGSGMISPDMATMLAFIFTDAAIAKLELQRLLAESAEETFNSITVDSDTSTNDAVLAFASGLAKNEQSYSIKSRELLSFRNAFQDVMLDLAHQVVRDGEGATKFVEIGISGAESDAAARVIGLVIANSPLVKTAIAGEDANWGRIVMAVGKSGERIDRDKLALTIGGIQIAKLGCVVPGYDELPVHAHMKGQEILIEVDVGVGTGLATVWTCDLTHGYISINADYRS
ncbi:MAG TPA: bifunctional glutamate N-acetyltransferase/amino-acid acetyltransferase ArgJ [Rhodospirillales bacterium]|nr:MAG: Arginine biosynthesis bifunctional protein ArgJ [Alphaproteobacteria bacterium MarineAlpha3_Bin6]HIB20653.1 bifunctional glutamate N-acetyltransferase/amino-acid acetyltransferase ArgJ [Rhodospirillales bacterium]HIC59414.1 bifunctional glutamate N-acetyltransferase/amino-acid acetyltransferase ArgJ [Rhodospirillales bacterium]HIN74620.1 bifunctional glutamate N-acetyltransferase/amino-acid acetyltransferase ArgJ [Rhodospirillales bacterium]HIO39042.1 bifunctional glutamate N-acetyltran|tara:strand:- start:1511 stop:2737 length:1227 start_codon:yes stop_codon:yes gene_type:complete